MQKDIDIIIYGATGFTGQLCVKYFQSLNTDVNWAIAGRDQDKLQKVASDNSVDVEMLIADSDDEVALDILTSRAKVILSTRVMSPVVIMSPVVPFKIILLFKFNALSNLTSV